MKDRNAKKGWERTNVTNLLRNRQSGIYYARVKVNGKEKWKTLKTSVASIAKLRLGDFERQVRAQGLATGSEDRTQGTDDATMGRYIAIYRQRTKESPSLAAATKTRLDNAVKSIIKTWPDLPFREAKRITPSDCRQWAARALRDGTGFVAPQAKTVRVGMAPRSFNKCLDTLRGIFSVAHEMGAIYANPTTGLAKAAAKDQPLELPSMAQFHAIVKSISEAGARQSKDCADMIRLLAYSGARVQEAAALTWGHLDTRAGRMTIPGTKTNSSHRVVPLFPPLAAMLKQLQERRGDEPATGSILRVNECKGALTTACKAVGVKRLTHHDFRHLFATQCIESGVDIPTVSRWLGHSDGGALAMRTYGHLRQEHSQAQAAKVTFGDNVQ